MFPGVTSGGGSLVALTAMCGYLVVLGAIGYYGYRGTNDEADFLIAGREVGTVVGAGTLLASQISASTVVGAVGVHYAFGVGFAWVWAGILVGWLVALAYVAPQLRRFGGMTVPDFVGARYADDGRDGDYVRALTASLLVAVSLVFLTVQYVAGGLVFRELLGVTETVGVALTATVAVGYTAFGGMRASVLTDFVQSVVIVVGLVVAVPLALSEVGGLATLVGRVRGVDPSLLGQAFPLPELAGFVAASAVGIAVAPVEVSRFYSMRDEETVRTAIGLSLVGQAVIAGSVVVLGLTARVLFPELSTPDLAAIVLSQEVLGPVFGTLLVVAVLSAILSTADSVMIVTSGGIAHDFYARILDTDAGERRKLLVSRVTVLAVGTVPVVMALNGELLGGLITFITLLNLSLWGSTLFVPVVLGLHWRRTTTAGAIAGLLSGFVTVVVWYVASEILGVVPDPLGSIVADPVFPGLLSSSLVTVGVSLLTGPPSRRSTDRFFTGEE